MYMFTLILAQPLDQHRRKIFSTCQALRRECCSTSPQMSCSRRQWLSPIAWFMVPWGKRWHSCGKTMGNPLRKMIKIWVLHIELLVYQRVTKPLTFHTRSGKWCGFYDSIFMVFQSQATRTYQENHGFVADVPIKECDFIWFDALPIAMLNYAVLLLYIIWCSFSWYSNVKYGAGSI